MHWNTRGTIRIEVLAVLLLTSVAALLLWPERAGFAVAQRDAAAIAQLRALRTTVLQHHARTGRYPVASELTDLPSGVRFERNSDSLAADGYIFKLWIPSELGGATGNAAQRSANRGEQTCALMAWPQTRAPGIGRILAWIPDETWAVDNLNTPYVGNGDAPPPTLLGGRLDGRALGLPIRWADRLPWQRVEL